MALEMVTFVVPDYQDGLDFFVGHLGWRVSEDVEATANDGSTKRWVVVEAADGGPKVLLARAANALQRASVGRQTTGRVGFFLRVLDFDETLGRLRTANLEIVGDPRTEPYGRVVVFRDPFGNLWDLLGPLQLTSTPECVDRDSAQDEQGLGAAQAITQ